MGWLAMIEKSGLCNLSAEEYQADPAPLPSLSAGIVEILIRESPLHAWHAHPRLNPNYKPEVKEEFDIGQAGHALLFEGVDQMQVFDPADYPNQKGGGVATGWTNKAIREARDNARTEGRIPILLGDSIALRGMVNAARTAWEANDDLKGYPLDGGRNEWSIIWEDGKTAPYDPIWCRCKPDHLSSDRRLIVDAKFTEASANPLAFEHQIARMAYDSRSAFYLRGNASTGGPEDARYVYLVQEQKPPYAAAFIGLDPAYVEFGHRKVERAIALWRQCMQTNRWLGYLNRIHWAQPPAYAVAQWEEQEMRGFEYDPAVLFGKETV